jgi:hypothetical protein
MTDKQVRVGVVTVVSIRKLMVFVVCLSVFLLWAQQGYAVTANDGGKPIDKSNEAWPCFQLSDVIINVDGLVVATFSYSYGRNGCKKEIYFVKSKPAGKIRGIFGIKGTKVKSGELKLLVTPDTAGVFIEMAGQYGKLAGRIFDFRGYLAAAKRQNSGWQTAWKRSESRLQEDRNTDKTPPKIILRSPDVTPQRRAFRVDTYQIFVRGQVQDASGVGAVLVNGVKARVKADGSFAKKVRLALGTNKMRVQAEDIHGNISERTFAVIREEFIPDDSLTDVDIPPKSGMSKPDGIAVVIGVESYQYVQAATYAYNDAEVVREYIADTMGFKKDRVKLATNTRATRAELDRLLGSSGWLARNVVKGKSDVVVYFSGHGIPDPKSQKVGLLPFDVDPNYSVGLPLDELTKNLSRLGARSVTLILDTCFSGQTRERKLLLADARGLKIVPRMTKSPGGVTILSAATGAQISGPLKSKEHGVFTYYLLKGLSGEADENRDKSLTMNELSTYVSQQVKVQAARLGWEQTPQLTGTENRVLVRF